MNKKQAFWILFLFLNALTLLFYTETWIILALWFVLIGGGIVIVLGLITIIYMIYELLGE